MFKKERDKPLKLKKGEAILRRLPISHQKRDLVQQDCYKLAAGYRGELMTDYYLKFFRASHYDIFLDIRLPMDEGYFQIDTLLVTPYCITIIEVKNFAGTLHFDDDLMQMIRILDQKEEGYSHPHLQVRRNEIQLKKWLMQKKIPEIPIETLIVISNPSTIVKRSRPSATHNIIHAANLPFTFDRISEKYHEERLLKKDLRKIASCILKEHTHDQTDILRYYSICRNELLKGVHCPKCFHLPMNREKGVWKCQSCQFYSKTAHLDSINDYALLINQTITNQEMRDFLQIRSRAVVHDILKNMKLESNGTTKGKSYTIPLR